MTTTIPYQDARLTALLGDANNVLIKEGLYAAGWRIAFDRAKSRAGNCNPHKRLITVSLPWARLNTDAEVRDTFLHEIAHAAAGCVHGHDRVWKAHARRLGARPSYRASEDTQAPPGRYAGTCERCGTVAGYRHKRTKSITSPAYSFTHKRCGGKIRWIDTVTGSVVR